MAWFWVEARDLGVSCKVREELAHLIGAHGFGMSFVVEEDEALDDKDISFNGCGCYNDACGCRSGLHRAVKMA